MYPAPLCKEAIVHSDSDNETNALVDTTSLSHTPSSVSQNQRESAGMHETAQGSFWIQWNSNLIAQVKPYILLITLLMGTFTLIALVGSAWNYSRNDSQHSERQNRSFLDKMKGEIIEDPSTPHLSGKQMIESFYQQQQLYGGTATDLKYFHFSLDGVVDDIEWTPGMRSLQAEREPLSVHVRVNPWHQSVVFAHHDPKVDVYVSRALSRGSLFEQNAVVAVADHLDLILGTLEVLKEDIPPHSLSFIDIGANLGVYSVGLGARFLHRFPSLDIFAFEPSDENLALLTSSLRQNELSNVYLYPYGLTDSGNLGDTVSFVIDDKNKGHNHVENGQSWSEHDGESVQIETVPLDVFNKILENRYPEMYQSWSNAVWLKMDTEGMEPYIIRGGRKSMFSNSEMDPCFIKLEFAKHKEEIYTLLVDAGYEMVHFDWNSIAQHRVYSRQEAINKPDWDATFAKKDAGKCVRRKLENAHGTSADIEKQKQMKIAKCSDRVRPLPVIDHREELGNILEAEGMTVGLEVGVKQGEMSAAVLERWTKCENYYLMDPWEHQDHYQNGANVAQNVQDRYFQETKQRLKKFESRGVELHYIRDYSTNGHQEIADNSLDFVYIDARHDYQAMQQDLALFWPKLKCGGIFAGHDFCNANEEPLGQDWCTFADGTRCENGKAVKAAVEEFAAILNKQIVVPRRETDFVTWYMRK